MSGSKQEGMFAKLSQHAKAVEEHAAPLTEPVIENAALPPALLNAAKPKRSTAKVKAEPITEKGRRSNPEYCQMNGYVHRKLRQAIRRELLDMDGYEYSELLEDLLTKWLKSRNVSV